MRRIRFILLVAAFGMPGCQTIPASDISGVQVPEACGFAEGVALEYAGRSTTAVLGVQEVPGDPMSHEPADIYITRDRFDQGERHGRLVCAVFVDQPDFVEVTVHPADDPFVPPTPTPLGSEPANGIARADAVDIALNHVGHPDDWDVAVVEAGSVARLVYDWENVQWARELPADHWIWRVFLVRGDEGVDVFIDYVDGTVLGELRYIVN